MYTSRSLRRMRALALLTGKPGFRPRASVLAAAIRLGFPPATPTSRSGRLIFGEPSVGRVCFRTSSPGVPRARSFHARDARRTAGTIRVNRFALSPPSAPAGSRGHARSSQLVRLSAPSSFSRVRASVVLVDSRSSPFARELRAGLFSRLSLFLARVGWFGYRVAFARSRSSLPPFSVRLFALRARSSSRVRAARVSRFDTLYFRRVRWFSSPRVRRFGSVIATRARLPVRSGVGSVDRSMFGAKKIRPSNER